LRSISPKNVSLDLRIRVTEGIKPLLNALGVAVMAERDEDLLSRYSATRSHPVNDRLQPLKQLGPLSGFVIGSHRLHL
jgi:hypothetical protein